MLGTLLAGTSFWSTAMTSRLTLICAAVAVGCVAMLAIAARAMVHLGRPARANRPTLAADTSAVATIEFALALPVLLFLILLLTQTTLLMGGNLFVHYAAYAATRTAIVQIPVAYGDDLANQYTHTEGRAKYDAIARAAVLAVVPVSGRSDAGSALINAEQVVDGLSSFYSDYGRSNPNWVDALVADRINYAAANTSIHVALPQVRGNEVDYQPITDGRTHTFDPRDPVTVQVVHRLNLSTPWVNRLIYADGEHDDGAGYYRDVWAESTLNLEGIRDDMPPQPALRREP